MAEAKQRLWPFSPRASLIATAVLFVGLMLLVATLRFTADWPSVQSEGIVLIGILVLSLLPIVLAFLDAIIDRGAVIELGGVKLAFAQSKVLGASGLTIPANIGVRGKAIAQSSTVEILDALKQATTHDVAIVDLEEGGAWWETRLLVLLAGAERRGKPDKIVFVGIEATEEQRFQGWSYARDLLPSLANANPKYKACMRAARSVVSQLALAEPSEAPAHASWQSSWGPLAKQYQWMATGQASGFLAEQVLQSELGTNVEVPEGGRSITLVRLEELFRPVLHKDPIDLSWPADRQLDTFLKTGTPYLAITQDGRYSALVSRLTLLNQLLPPLLGRQKT